MYCQACGAEQPEGAKFCKSCGQPVAGAHGQPTAAVPPLAAAAPVTAYPPLTYPAPAAGPARGKLLIILGIVLLVVVAGAGVLLLFTVGSGDEGVAGTYYGKSGESTLELKSDGTFTIDSSGIELEGTYEVRGDELTLVFFYFGMESEMDGTIKDGRITIEGEVYQKR